MRSEDGTLSAVFCGRLADDAAPKASESEACQTMMSFRLSMLVSTYFSLSTFSDGSFFLVCVCHTSICIAKQKKNRIKTPLYYCTRLLSWRKTGAGEGGEPTKTLPQKWTIYISAYDKWSLTVRQFCYADSVWRSKKKTTYSACLLFNTFPPSPPLPPPG